MSGKSRLAGALSVAVIGSATTTENLWAGKFPQKFAVLPTGFLGISVVKVRAFVLDEAARKNLVLFLIRQVFERKQGKHGSRMSLDTLKRWRTSFGRQTCGLFAICSAPEI